MKNLVERIEQHVTTAARISECETAFAVPGSDSLIDCINPNTGRSWINDETLDQIRLRYPLAGIVNISAHCSAIAERQDTPIEWQETTRDQYEEMLNVLPPADYNRTFTAFLVGEPWDHHATTGRPRYQGFEIRGGKYWQSNRPMTRKEFRSSCA